MASGIYQILNLVNEHSYIGQAYDLEGRKKVHFHALRKGKSGHNHLQNAFNRYGEEKFEFVVLDHIGNLETLDFWEQVYFFLFHPEYNVASIAGRPPGGCQKGQTYVQRYGLDRAADIKQKLSKTYIEQFGIEYAADLCHQRSETTKQAWTPERRLNQSEKRKGKLNPFYGKRHSRESRFRMGELHKKWWTPERRLEQGERARNARKGKTYDEIYGPERAIIERCKRSEALKGRTWNEIHGLEHAAQLRQNYQEWMNERRKGKTYEEIYGPERAAEIKQKIGIASKAYWARIRAIRNQNVKKDI